MAGFCGVGVAVGFDEDGGCREPGGEVGTGLVGVGDFLVGPGAVGDGA